jgi:hypothetical protein
VIKVTMILTGFVVGQLGPVPFSFRATNLTMEECQRTLKAMHEQIQSWGASPKFKVKECR